MQYQTAQIQVDACELKTCECEVTFYEKIAFEFLSKTKSLAQGTRDINRYSLNGYSLA